METLILHPEMHRSFGGTLGPSPMGGLRSGVYDGKIAGLYDLEETLGRGHFAVVKLAKHVFTGEKVAVKVIDKSKLDEVSKAHLFQEVRCMKLVQHPNVVRLYEVIDTATKLYLILELGDGGDLYDYIMRHDSGLSEQVAREYFRQIVRAITYCHQLHVVHRDLKPENVVFFEKLGVVKLTDFGFSNKFCPGQKLETSCGSLAYSAPEILLGDSYDAPAVDVWSLGVILYMLVCGQAPFQEANDSETLTMIMDCKYTVPQHVSKECKDLIARMLVRAPEKRATLKEISSHPWLAAVNKQDNHNYDAMPLVSREQLSEDDHNLIVQKIVNGNIATKEEIQECLDKNEYNHITATYYLLAERKLRAKRQETVNKEHPVTCRGTLPCLLSVPRTPGDLPQRSRKCSIVQEDEEEEDISSCSGREELTAPHCSLNRRGSRSEGRLNLALQERLADTDRRKPCEDVANKPKPLSPVCMVKPDCRPRSAQDAPLRQAINANKIKNNLNYPRGILKDVTTTIITEASTISIPVITHTPAPSHTTPKYKTMPSPTRTTAPGPLNEIFEEGDNLDNATLASRQASRQLLSRSQHRSSYEQRRSKFHKSRTASCSSSDASDDDSENRKKRAHKLNAAPTPGKPLQGRRDSHDDSSDSQEPGTGASTTGHSSRISAPPMAQQTSKSNSRDAQAPGQQTSKSNSRDAPKSNNTNTNSGRKNCSTDNQSMLGRRHKASRRRTGETRLRESQSLNRITEVQEDTTTHAVVISTNLSATQGASVVPKVKGFGARILQGFTGSKKQTDAAKNDDKVQHISRKDCGSSKMDSICADLKEEGKLPTSKRMRILGKYFHVHKKFLIPIPGLFTRNRLYKAQSCGSLTRDKINITESVIRKQRAVSVIRNSIGSDGDINQNMGETAGKDNGKTLQLNAVCNGLSDMCSVHLGQASKCSFC
ncbi:Protein kinase domain [Popillia japonica]|uniref:SNF-related serine/threonine-protein kinase n=1 Tax=Popillia japonica TaxID=7064 RepID=A0AAW1JTP9_POPJA